MAIMRRVLFKWAGIGALAIAASPLLTRLAPMIGRDAKYVGGVANNQVARITIINAYPVETHKR